MIYTLQNSLHMLPLKSLIELVSKFGLPGIILVLWWLTNRAQENALHCYREDTQELKRMYENSIGLVKRTQEIAGNYEKRTDELHDLVRSNIQAITGLLDDIKHNEYCPLVRSKKQVIEINKGV